MTTSIVSLPLVIISLMVAALLFVTSTTPSWQPDQDTHEAKASPSDIHGQEDLNPATWASIPWATPPAPTNSAPVKAKNRVEPSLRAIIKRGEGYTAAIAIRPDGPPVFLSKGQTSDGLFVLDVTADQVEYTLDGFEGRLILK